MSMRQTPSSISLALSTARPDARPWPTTSSTSKPAWWTHLITFWIEVWAPVAMGDSPTPMIAMLPNSSASPTTVATLLVPRSKPTTRFRLVKGCAAMPPVAGVFWGGRRHYSGGLLGLNHRFSSAGGRVLRAPIIGVSANVTKAHRSEGRPGPGGTVAGVACPALGVRRGDLADGGRGLRLPPHPYLPARPREARPGPGNRRRPAGPAGAGGRLAALRPARPAGDRAGGRPPGRGGAGHHRARLRGLRGRRQPGPGRRHRPAERGLRRLDAGGGGPR